MFNKVIPLTLLLAATNAAALNDGAQDHAIALLMQGQQNPGEMLAIDELNAESAEFDSIRADVSEVAQNYVFLEAWGQQALKEFNRLSTGLREIQRLNSDRPNGTPVWSRKDWKAWNAERAELLKELGETNKNTVELEEEYKERVTVAQHEVEYIQERVAANDARSAELSMRHDALSARTGYGGVSRLGNPCIDFADPRGLQYLDRCILR